MAQAIDWQESILLAESLHSTGFSCSQCVVGAFCEESDLDIQDAFRIASGFSGGCCSGEVCGAVSGAIMVIGLRHASTTADATDKRAGSKTYEITRRFMSRFRSRFGSVRCQDLIGYDLSELDTYQDIQGLDRALFTRCPSYVQAAVEILKQVSSSNS